MTRVYLITFADGSAAWAKPREARNGISGVWQHIQNGWSMRMQENRPVNAYALSDADYGVNVIVNRDHVQSVAEFPVFSA